MVKGKANYIIIRVLIKDFKGQKQPFTFLNKKYLRDLNWVSLKKTLIDQEVSEIFWFRSFIEGWTLWPFMAKQQEKNAKY